MKLLLRYFEAMTTTAVVLWCYLIWYAVTVSWHFDPDPKLWLNALGIGTLIGCGLLLSVSNPDTTRLGQWQAFRLFLIPFCVSSYSALIKDKGFIFIFSPDPAELISAVAFSAVFIVGVSAAKFRRKTAQKRL
jgi:hypothetical protein